MKDHSCEIYLHRHPPVDLPEGICYGRSDVALDQVKFEQWKDDFSQRRKDFASTKESAGDQKNRESDKVKSQTVLVYTSPSRRCLEAATFLSRSLASPPPLPLPGLLEMDFGKWEMRHWEEISNDPTSGFADWSLEWVEHPVPEGESYQELHQRVIASWEQIVRDAMGAKIPKMHILTHSGPIRAILSELLEIPLKNTFRLDLPYGSVCKINYSGDLPVVEYINREACGDKTE